MRCTRHGLASEGTEERQKLALSPFGCAQDKLLEPVKGQNTLYAARCTNQPRISQIRRATELVISTGSPPLAGWSGEIYWNCAFFRDTKYAARFTRYENPFFLAQQVGSIYN